MGPIEKTDNAEYNGTKSKPTQSVDSKKRYSKIREMSYDQKYTKTYNGAEDTVTDDDDDDDDDKQTDSVYENSFGCGCSERGTSDFVTDPLSLDNQTKHEKLGVGALGSSTEPHNTVSLKRKSLTIDKTFDASDVKKTSSSQKGNFDSMTESVISVAGNLNRCWQWLDRRGVWIDYPEDVNDQINHRLQQRPNTSVVVKCKEQRCFRIVPSKSIQINIESKERHSIRWQNSK
nr:uncharacterized protein LOC109619859 isoform X1 [Crassostrea gigas]XP_034323321.1 uncharacterized protein LOC109619859 isoform X1 [Crassostrea gigas]